MSSTQNPGKDSAERENSVSNLHVTGEEAKGPLLFYFSGMTESSSTFLPHPYLSGPSKETLEDLSLKPLVSGKGCFSMSTLWSDSYQLVTNVPGDKHAKSATIYLHKFIEASVLNTNITFSY